MGISDTRLKGKGMKESHNDYVLIWSGVDKNKRAVHGVGFYLHPELAKNIMEVDYISERIIRLRIQQEKEVITYIQVYAPCNDSYSDEDKDTFFEELSDVINSTKNQDMLVVMGDMNGHVGSERSPWEDYLGPHSAPNTNRNYNGQLILELCAQHDLFVTNTFFQHRSTQIFTWYKWNDLTKASQLDFILIKKTDRCTVNDSKAMPNIHIDTDHRPVMMETSARRRPQPNKRQQPETINLRKLAEEPVKAAIEQQMDQLFQKLPDQEGNTEEEWTWFKDALTDTLKANCGTKKRKTGQVKGTSWWNDTVKAATKEKKRLFKKWSKATWKQTTTSTGKPGETARRLSKKPKTSLGKHMGKTWQKNQIARAESSLKQLKPTNSGTSLLTQPPS
ncbi:craniofacial development protein 2-like [Amphiura filiformis]|uniref:craniofacial development protein 2-like n=1 Tax=Amphiura filiformis TaxID=82378 RepID=UPI003B20B5DE